MILLFSLTGYCITIFKAVRNSCKTVYVELSINEVKTNSF